MCGCRCHALTSLLPLTKFAAATHRNPPPLLQRRRRKLEIPSCKRARGINPPSPDACALIRWHPKSSAASAAPEPFFTLPASFCWRYGWRIKCMPTISTCDMASSGSKSRCPAPRKLQVVPLPLPARRPALPHVRQSLPCTRFCGKLSTVVHLNIAGRVQRRGPGREAAPHEQVALRPLGLRALRQAHSCAVETSAQPALSLLGTWGIPLPLLREPLCNDQLCFRWALAPLLECSSRIFHPPQ